MTPAVKVFEADLTPALIDELIAMSADWESENSCRGYRKNTEEDIHGRRVFLAKDGVRTAGYLFGKLEKSENMSSVMPEGTPFFEVEEIYVVPDLRSKGIGSELFGYAENAVRPDAEYILLSTATKNWRSILHFYIDELCMDFWSARLFKKLS